MRGRLTRRSTLAGLAAAPLAACSGEARGGALRFWAMGREGEVVQSVMPGFTAANPGLEVEVQQLPWSAAHAKLLTAFAGGDLPDLIQIGNTWLPEFVALNAFERLDGRLRGSVATGPQNGFAGIWATNVVAGGLYGVPWYVDTRLLFYRRDLLAKAGHPAPPSTWEEWLATMEAVKGVAGAGNYSALLPLDEYEPLLTLALQQDDPLLAAGGGRGNFQSPGFKAALGFYGEIFRRGLAPPAADTQIGNLYDEFARGYFSFLVTGPWNLGEFARRLPAADQGVWATAPMPGPRGPGAGIAGGSSLAVRAGSPRADAAWTLIEYLTEPRIQSQFWSLIGDLPAVRAAWTAPSLASDPHAAAFRSQLERVKPTPKVPEWERIATEMQLVAEQMVRERISVESAAAEIDRRADRLLEKRRWMLSRGLARPA
ncbi:MAG TPA: sugar ABC transporter substrate-binding protein [Caulobacteraceae bacterium]